MEEVEFDAFSLGIVRLDFNQNPPDQRGDGLDRNRHGEEPHQRHCGVRQARMDALTNRPDLVFAGQVREGLDSMFGDHLVELANQSLIGTEYNDACRSPISPSCAFCH